MIYVVGSVNLDYVAHVQKLPRPGETVLGSELRKTPGGKGANQALAARRAGAAVRLVACVGRDDDGIAATASLAKSGVDLTSVQKCDMPTGVALIQIDAAAENSIAVLPGANSCLSAGVVRGALSGLKAGNTVILQQEVPQEATRTAIEMARAAGAFSVLNVAPVLPESASLASLADMVIANETEFQAIFGQTPTAEAAQEWCQATGRRLALTLGADGAILAGGDAPRHLRPPKITPVDTVGAGDTFVGYLAAGLHAHMAPEQALDVAIRASAQACLYSGAQSAIPWIDQIRVQNLSR